MARSYVRQISRELADGRCEGATGALRPPTAHGMHLAPSQTRAPNRTGHLQLTAPPRPPVRRCGVSGLEFGRRAAMPAPGGAPTVRRRSQGLQEANRTPATQANLPQVRKRKRGTRDEQEPTPGTCKKAGGAGAGKPKPQRHDRERQRRLALEPAQEAALQRTCEFCFVFFRGRVYLRKTNQQHLLKHR